jgi:hypothetical protein
VKEGKIEHWGIVDSEERNLASSEHPKPEVKLALLRNFEFKIPLAWLTAASVPSADRSRAQTATKVRLRFSFWQNGLPADALPLEGWIELQLLTEPELMALAF